MERVKGLKMVDLLPLTLAFQGRPMNMRENRPMFRPLFERVPTATKQLFLCGRQVGKTFSANAAMLMHLLWRRYFKVLYVTPLALYTDRLHHLYMSPAIKTCRLPYPIQDSSSVVNVREKSFLNGSHFHGVSCYNSAGNALGIPVDALIGDEIQDLNLEFIPQIRETMGTSDFRWEFYFGTARGMENTIQRLFEKTTMSEFSVRCGCGHWNIPSADRDALRMIQPHGIACAKCSKLLNVEDGKWIHAVPSRAKEFIGWHVPQTIVKARTLPHPKYVDTIYNKLHGSNPYPISKFMQEVMGISTEQGGSPISAQQIKDASTLKLGPNFSGYQEINYSTIAGGVDWGGSEVTSFTVGVVVAFNRGSNKFHVVGATRPIGYPDNERHFPVSSFMNALPGKKPIAIGGDALFVGMVQNKNLSAVSGIPVTGILYGAGKRFYTSHPNNLFSVDRDTLLFCVYTLIKEQKLLFPEGAWFEPFTEDLKALYIEEMQTPTGISVRRFKRYESMADDFTHSLAYAVFALALLHGIDLPGLVGLDAGGSVSASFLGDTGGENVVLSRPDLFQG